MEQMRHAWLMRATAVFFIIIFVNASKTVSENIVL